MLSVETQATCEYLDVIYLRPLTRMSGTMYGSPRQRLTWYRIQSFLIERNEWENPEMSQDSYGLLKDFLNPYKIDLT